MSILLYPGKKTVTAAIKIAGLSCHFGNFHKFLNQYVWDVQELSFRLLDLLVRTLGIEGKLTFALDDTLIKKFGKKIFGCGWHHDHAAKKNDPKYIYGHNWVFMALLHFSPLVKKWLCFPIRAKLYVPKKVRPEGEQHISRIKIAIEMLKKFRERLNAGFIIVADALYAKKDLIRYCLSSGVVMISRIRIDAALYRKPKPKKKRGRGRPRKYGKRLPSLKTLGKRSKKFQEYELVLYGKKMTLPVQTFTAIWKPAGQLIRIFIVKYPGKKTVSCFFCTDINMSVEAVLTRVAARWSIEIAFRNMKQHLGLTDYQCRISTAVERFVNLVGTSLSLLTLWSHEEYGKKEPELWDSLPWYSHKGSASVQDMIRQLKYKCFHDTIIDSLWDKPISREKINALDNVLKWAA